MSAREYDIVIWGATGYTGKLTAEYVASSLPTDIKWAISGRSSSKLQAVAEKCQDLNPDRVQPAIEICNLNDSELSVLAKKTKLLIAAVGPYALYGEPAFKACAENGTHYLDVTGEVAYVYDMIKKYEEKAKATGAIMIPQTGVDSAPPDLVTWVIVNMIKDRLSVKTGEVVVSIYEMKAEASGGTLATALGLMDVYTLQELAAAGKPYALSPIPGPKTASPNPLITKLLGIRTVPGLGLQTTFIGSVTDAPIVQRSWGLLGGASFYGPNFHFSPFMKARNYLTGITFHFALVMASILLTIKPLRQLLKRYVYQPGEGPSVEKAKGNRIEYRGIGTPDMTTPNPPRAYCRAKFEGDMYVFTAVLLAEAAMVILRDNSSSGLQGGGIYTPACLGQKYVDRMDKAGFGFETKWFED